MIKEYRSIIFERNLLCNDEFEIAIHPP